MSLYCLFFIIQTASALVTRDFGLEVTATIQENPARITLNWRPTTETRDFEVSRKLKHETSWTSLAVLPPTATSYTDSNVVVGQAYEYAVTRIPQPVYARSGYIYAGIRVPLIDSRGKVLLIVEESHGASLSAELARLKQDLVGDGWTVIRRNVSRHSTPAYVRGLIQAEYQADSDLRSVFLFGRVPVPYSGNYNADDHADHTGAWPADVFYGDINGTWTDSTVNTTSATRSENHNVPGDGKFDQTTLPSNVDLEVGRVDLANMPAFLPKTELDLLRQYLNKNHNFRHAKFTVPRRGILFDGFGVSGGEAYAASGWRNLAPFFGSGNIHEVGQNQYFPTVSSQGYLWTYVGSGGGKEYDNCHWVGITSDFAAVDIRTVFTMFFGSYFGDWDSSNNFLRAPLGSANHALVSIWAGRPHWFLHHMALGETVGYSTRLSQNNSGLYQPTQFTRQVHIALMGDPTLRMHVVQPPSNLVVSRSGNTATLSWAASSDPSLVGYHVYRSISANGPFARITGNSPITQRSFVDNAGGSYTYMVRAINLETSASGSYFNASQGIFATSATPQAEFDPPASIRGQSITLFPNAGTGVTQTLLLVAAPTGNTLRVFPQNGTNAVQSGTYNYTKNSSSTATISFSGTQIVLNFTAGASGAFSATSLAGNSYSGTFSMLETGPDFNGDGRADFVFQTADGVLFTWLMNGPNFLGASLLREGLSVGSLWRTVSAADFNGDGKPDILLRDQNCRLAVWLMDGTQISQGLYLRNGQNGNPLWRSVAVADFNGDGHKDILFQHNNGSLAVWLMNGTDFVQSVLLRDGHTSGSAWRAFAAADLNGDRKPDVLFHNNHTGKLAVWYFDDLTFLGGDQLRGGHALPLQWRALGVSDLNNDGKLDIIFQHDAGALAGWYMDGKEFLGAVSIRDGHQVGSGARLVAPR
ncbi:MAG: FG-GAP-like repeat-containing protein [Limisphaerales bacterium]